VRQNGEQLFEHGIVGGVVEALVLGLLAQRHEHGGQREMARGVPHQRVDAVVVVQKTGHVPAEHVQYVPERFADQFVRAHHPDQRRVLLPMVERLHLCAGRQHGDLPHTRVPRHRRDHVVAHRSQERV